MILAVDSIGCRRCSATARALEGHGPDRTLSSRRRARVAPSFASVGAGGGCVRRWPGTRGALLPEALCVGLREGCGRPLGACADERIRRRARAAWQPRVVASVAGGAVWRCACNPGCRSVLVRNEHAGSRLGRLRAVRPTGAAVRARQDHRAHGAEPGLARAETIG
jgi:hypothetical protein